MNFYGCSLIGMIVFFIVIVLLLFFHGISCVMISSFIFVVPGRFGNI